VPSIQIWKSSLVVERHDGNETYFGPALADYDRLAELIQRRTFPGHGWRPAIGCYPAKSSHSATWRSHSPVFATPGSDCGGATSKN